MLTIAYLANRFPSPVEPYVAEEIEGLRRRGVQVIAGSVRRLEAREQSAPEVDFRHQIVTLQPLRIAILLRAAWLCMRRWKRIKDLLRRVILRGNEPPPRRLKALLHTWLGGYYALLLEDRRVKHIHVHHGYFGSWIAMVAARLLDVGFSMTLHGSDLLLHGAYLDTKLEACRFCLTISEYNQRYILQHYPTVQAKKILVARLGVDVHEPADFPALVLPTTAPGMGSGFTLIAVGRLHAVKDHAFLLRACAQLRVYGLSFECCIAGEGPERRNLESLIRKYGLEERVTLLGHVPRNQINSLYERADVVVLTSRSEGLPLVLMEAMARGKIVLAPAITGIPELVITGKTGFLYEPGALGDFVAQLLFIHSLRLTQRHSDRRSHILSATNRLDWVRHGAKVQVHHNFSLRKNLESFEDVFIQRTTSQNGGSPHEDFVLQQI